MKIHSVIISILLLLSGTAAVSAASMSGNTVTVTSPLDAAALVYVSGYESSPAVFYPGETGTVTVHLTNAANTSVSVDQPNLLDPHIHVVNTGAYATATSIGPGETVDYFFVVTADNSEGTYFPLFTVSTHVMGAAAIHAQIKVRIDGTDVRASIAAKPDTFAVSTKDTVNVSITNPRAADITNVLVIPESAGAEIFPEESFVGTVKAGESVQVPFAITPDAATDVTFHVTFFNGDNEHSLDLVLPVNIGENKKGARMIVNNIESSGLGSTITLKGDVTNNGLTDARSVLVTVGSPATPVNPNPVYAIGNLEPDDFSSFEVTYTRSGPGPIPVIVEFKDSDGNVFTERFTVSGNAGGETLGASGSAGSPAAPAGISSGTANRRPGGMFGSFGSGLNQVPVTEIVIGLAAIIAILIAWRKGLLRRVTDRFRRKPASDEEIPEQ